jgi:hypothetical protein
MRCFIFIVIWVAGVVQAQELSPVKCRLLAFADTEELPPVITLSDKGTEIECPLSTSQLSPTIVCYAKGNSIAFLSASDRSPLATATLPAATKAAILIFVPGPKGADAGGPGKAPWRVLVIEDSPKNFPDGGAFVANFFNNEIRFILGEHKGMLRAAGTHGYAMPTERDSFNMAPVVVEFLKEDKWHIANESALRFLPSMRYLIIAYADPVSGRPRINTYQDMAGPPD